MKEYTDEYRRQTERDFSKGAEAAIAEADSYGEAEQAMVDVATHHAKKITREMWGLNAEHEQYGITHASLTKIGRGLLPDKPEPYRPSRRVLTE